MYLEMHKLHGMLYFMTYLTWEAALARGPPRITLNISIKKLQNHMILDFLYKGFTLVYNYETVSRS